MVSSAESQSRGKGAWMKLLLIEDETRTASHLRRGLSEHRFVVDISGAGEGLQLARHQTYDLVILGHRAGRPLPADINNPARVLVLCEAGALPDQIRELRLEADQYLSKPFLFSELLARIESILRRVRVYQPEIVSIAGLSVDLLRHKATRNGKRLDLTPREFHLLALLARRPGTVFSRTFIAEQLWGTDFDRDGNLLDARVRRLRCKVDDPFEKRLIHTVRRLGYVLEDRPARETGESLRVSRLAGH